MQFLRAFSGYIVCAGSNANELRVVSEERSEVYRAHLDCHFRRSCLQVVGVQSSPSAFYSLDTNVDCTLIVAGGADKSVTLYTLVRSISFLHIVSKSVYCRHSSRMTCAHQYHHNHPGEQNKFDCGMFWIDELKLSNNNTTT